MLKAEQNKLAHEVSVNLADIRNIELQYYMTFFNTIAVQFTFIAGYQLTTYYNTEALYNTSFTAEIQEAFQVCYWFFTVVSVFLALEGMLVSVYTVMFGQGLALRGPAGSMIRAITGFEREQKHVLIVFSLTLFFLGTATIFQFYVVMDWIGADLCAVVAIVGMYHWYRHCMDIYNRYKFKKESADWKKCDDLRASDIEGGVHEGHDYDANPLDREERRRQVELLQREPSTGGFITIVGDGTDAGAGSGNTNTNTKGKSSSFFRGMFSTKPKVEAHWAQPVGAGAIAAIDTSNPLRSLHKYADDNFQGILFDGEVDVRSNRGVSGKRDNGDLDWVSRYVVLIESNYIMFYNSKAEYNASVTASACRTQRPLDLTLYCYRVVSSASASTGNDGRDIILLSLADSVLSQQLLERDGSSQNIELRCQYDWVGGPGEMENVRKTNKVDTEKCVAAIAMFAQPASSRIVQTV